MSSPFNITFGELRKSVVPREKDYESVRSAFNDPSPESKVCIISGPRGSGKTVLLTALSESFEQDGYIVVDLNPFTDLHEQFAAKLYEKGKRKKSLMTLSRVMFLEKGPPIRNTAHPFRSLPMLI